MMAENSYNRRSDEFWEVQPQFREETRPRRLELPLFSSDNPYGWLNRAERYFHFNGIDDQEKLEAAAVCFEGNLYVVLMGLQQTGSVAQYREDFELLSTPLKDANDAVLMGIFTKGLRGYVARTRRLCRRTRPDTTPVRNSSRIRSNESGDVDQHQEESWLPYRKGETGEGRKSATVIVVAGGRVIVVGISMGKKENSDLNYHKKVLEGMGNNIGKEGNADVVLVLERLKTLGDIQANFKMLTLKFEIGGQTRVIHGDPSLSRSVASLKILFKALQKDGKGYYVDLNELTTKEDQENLDLQQLLQEFGTSFEELKRLPPSRSHDQAILLNEGSNPPNIRASITSKVVFFHSLPLALGGVSEVPISFLGLPLPLTGASTTSEVVATFLRLPWALGSVSKVPISFLRRPMSLAGASTTTKVVFFLGLPLALKGVSEIPISFLGLPLPLAGASTTLEVVATFLGLALAIGSVSKVPISFLGRPLSLAGASITSKVVFFHSLPLALGGVSEVPISFLGLPLPLTGASTTSEVVATFLGLPRALGSVSKVPISFLGRSLSLAGASTTLEVVITFLGLFLALGSVSKVLISFLGRPLSLADFIFGNERTNSTCLSSLTRSQVHSRFGLPVHAPVPVGPGREGGVRVGKSPKLVGEWTSGLLIWTWALGGVLEVPTSFLGLPLPLVGASATSEIVVTFLGLPLALGSVSEVPISFLGCPLPQQDPSDKKTIICDEQLKELFQVDSFHGFTVTKLLTAHFVK
ncbi:hypothetical protein BC332_02428 [Capsicum chinense]|nr:hypothetical protein BC332_02428 [Capsicum chinense]